MQQNQQNNNNNRQPQQDDKNQDNQIIEEKFNQVNGTVHVRKYQKGKLLGKGGFAKCFEVTNLETKKIQAAKIIPKNTLNKTRARQKLISEIKIHKSLHNKNIVDFEHVFEDNLNVYILLELCPNQTLNEIIKRRKKLHELECMCYVVQILNALQYIHKNRVIHRDLKLGNLFLGRSLEIKLGDFGLATRLEFDDEKKRTICGTPNYIAPEILDDKAGHSYPVDIWSLGVIIYTLLIGKPPFETEDVKTTYNKIKQCQYSFPPQAKIEDNAKQLIIQILQTDPSKRPTIDQIFSHPFLNQCQIPAHLPQSSIAIPLTKEFIRTYVSTGAQNKNLTRNGGYESESNKNFGTNTQNFNQMNTIQSVGQFNQNTNNIQQAPGVAQNNGNLNGFDEQMTIYVSKWVDYSNKYGLGYLLTNGGAGVYFNDSTKIIQDNHGNFEYFIKVENQKQDECQFHTLENYPKDQLSKKVTLLQHFRSYLLDKATEVPDHEIQRPFVYIKKWIKTRHAMMFRLSNKLVQVNFTDHTQILLSSQLRIVIYVNKKGEKSNHPLDKALESENTDMVKRLKYTKEILSTLLNNNAQAKQQQQQYRPSNDDQQRYNQQMEQQESDRQEQQ